MTTVDATLYISILYNKEYWLWLFYQKKAHAWDFEHLIMLLKLVIKLNISIYTMVLESAYPDRKFMVF